MQQMVMINAHPQEVYRRQDVMTASSLDLIVMLYDALKKNLILGRRKIEKKDASAAHKHLMRAQEIVAALVNSLDMNYTISGELLSIYDFVLGSIEQANIYKDAEPLEPLVEMVDTLRSAWYEISVANKGNILLGEEQA